MNVNPLRHQAIFDPYIFNDKKLRIDVIGVGATGSHVVMLLGDLGIEGNLIHVWDFDKVDEHNIANQAFAYYQQGFFKTEMIRDRVQTKTGGTRIQIHSQEFTGTDEQGELGDIVFLLTDSMDSRKQIYDVSLKWNMKTKLVIETRLDTDNFRIYAFDPNSPADMQKWEDTLYTSEEASASLCGTVNTLGPTAYILAGKAVWQMIKWYDYYYGKSEDKVEFEVIEQVRPNHYVFVR